MGFLLLRRGWSGGRGISYRTAFVTLDIFCCCERRGLSFWMDSLVVVN